VVAQGGIDNCAGSLISVMIIVQALLSKVLQLQLPVDMAWRTEAEG
jgi:hypothetical protein